MASLEDPTLDASIDKRLDRLWHRARGATSTPIDVPDIDDDMDDGDDADHEGVVGGHGAKPQVQVYSGSGGAPSRNPLAKKTRRRAAQQTTLRTVDGDAIQALKMRQMADSGISGDVQRIMMEMKVERRSLMSPHLPELGAEPSCARHRPFEPSQQKTTYEQALKLHTHPPLAVTEDFADSEDSDSSGLSSGLDSDDDEERPVNASVASKAPASSMHPAMSASVASQSRDSHQSSDHQPRVPPVVASSNVLPSSHQSSSSNAGAHSSAPVKAPVESPRTLCSRDSRDRAMSGHGDRERSRDRNREREHDLERRDRQRHRRERERQFARGHGEVRHRSSSADASRAKHARMDDDVLSAHSAPSGSASATAGVPTPPPAVLSSLSASREGTAVTLSESVSSAAVGAKRTRSPAVAAVPVTSANPSSSSRSSGRGKLTQLAVKLKRQADKMPKGSPGSDNWKVQHEMYMSAGLKFLEAAEELSSQSQFDSVAQYFMNFAKTYHMARFKYMACIGYQCAAFALYRRFAISRHHLQQQCQSLCSRISLPWRASKRAKSSPSPDSATSPSFCSLTPQNNGSADSVNTVTLSRKDADMLMSFLSGVKIVFSYQEMWNRALRLKPSQVDVVEHSLPLLERLEDTTMNDLVHVVRTAYSSDFNR